MLWAALTWTIFIQPKWNVSYLNMEAESNPTWKVLWSATGNEKSLEEQACKRIFFFLRIFNQTRGKLLKSAQHWKHEHAYASLSFTRLWYGPVCSDRGGYTGKTGGDIILILSGRSWVKTQFLIADRLYISLIAFSFSVFLQYWLLMRKSKLSNISIATSDLNVLIILSNTVYSVSFSKCRIRWDDSPDVPTHSDPADVENTFQK